MTPPADGLVIMSDLDGTLLGGDGVLTPRTRAALETAAAKGVEVVAITGRSHFSARAKLESTPIRWVVCSNGALIWDRIDDKIVQVRGMTGEVAQDARDRLRSAHPEAGFGWETRSGFRFDEAFVSAVPRVDEIGMGEDAGPLESSMEIVKLFACIPGKRRLELQQAVLAALPDTATASSSGADFVETTAAGVDKGSTAALFCEQRQIDPAAVVAFGDQLNDVSLLSWAGHSVAMGNAHSVVTDHADEVALSNVDDGVAVILERLFLERLTDPGT